MIFFKKIFLKLRPPHPPKYLLALLFVFGVLGWFITQHLIILKDVPDCGIRDLLHDWTLWFNHYCKMHPKISSLVLIVTSLWIDISVFILLISALFYGSGSRPLLSIGLFLFFRQILQFLVSLPLPPDMIWMDPGFPSILVTYHVSNDLYFSSHTGMSLLGALELARLNKKFLTFFGFFMLALEIWTVLSFQIHYTMDVYTAIITVFVVAWIAKKIAPTVDLGLCGLDSWIRK